MASFPTLATGTPPVPDTPFRGIGPFRYGDRGVFFTRDVETLRVLRYVTVYRGTLLYGDSGAGKSSLVNAGLLPQAVLDGFWPERIRVQPRLGEELVIERIAVHPDSATPCLPSLFSDDVESADRVVLSIDDFEAILRRRLAGETRRRSLLVFDQFEELITLFEETPSRQERDSALDQQRQIVEMLVRLLRDDSLTAKLLFVFREDFLGRVTKVFESVPDLVDHYVRLTEPAEDAVPEIIRGPFERFPGHYDREISPALAERVVAAMKERRESGPVSLSELQIVCLRLWEATDPDAVFARRGVQGIMVDYLRDSLMVLGEEQRQAAISLLGFMVTPSGARNVVSEEDLLYRAESEASVSRRLATDTLEKLESSTRLIRRERRRNLYFYEITSESLAPWLMRQRRVATLQDLATRGAATEFRELGPARSDPAVLYVRSYLLIRSMIGTLGIALPIIFIFGEAFSFGGSARIRGSMSAYYFTSMHDLFVTVLCFTGALLVVYLLEKTNTYEFWVSTVAGVALIGVAFFPTARPGLPFGSPRCGTTPMPQGCSSIQQLFGEVPVAEIHYTFELIFFLSMAWMCFLFANSERHYESNPRMASILISCGLVILGAVAWITVGAIVNVTVGVLTPLYLGEVIAFWAFGSSWLLKGRYALTLLPDSRPHRRPADQIKTE